MRWKDIPRQYESRLVELRRLNPYEIFDVPRDVTLEQLKAAYRRKMSTYHPDRAHTFMKEYAQEVSKVLNAAYDAIRKDRGLS